MSITRAQCTQIEADITKALEAINAEHGINLSTCTIKYGTEFSCKIRGDVVVKDEDGSVVSEELQMLRRLVPHLEGRSCRIDGSIMEIIGVCTDSKGRARRVNNDLAIQIKGAKGGKYKCSRETVCRNVIGENGLADPQPKHLPARVVVGQPTTPETPAAKPEVIPAPAAGTGSKKEQTIGYMLANPNATRAQVIEFLMNTLGSTKASASSTYQNAKVVVTALNNA